MYFILIEEWYILRSYLVFESSILYFLGFWISTTIATWGHHHKSIHSIRILQCIFLGKSGLVPVPLYQPSRISSLSPSFQLRNLRRVLSGMASPVISLTVPSGMSAAPTTILDLPPELILQIFSFLDRPLDLHYLLLSNKRFLDIHSYTKPRFPPHFPGWEDLHWRFPFPHLLLVASAHQLGVWAMKPKENRSKFLLAMKHGYEGLVDLANELTKITLEDIRDVFNIRYKFIEPLAMAIEKDCRLNIEREKRSQAFLSDPVKILLDCWIYFELFPAEKAINSNTLSADHEARLQFTIYCIGDFGNKGSNFGWERSLDLSDLCQLSLWNVFCDESEEAQEGHPSVEILRLFKPENLIGTSKLYESISLSLDKKRLLHRTASWLRIKSFCPIVPEHIVIPPADGACRCYLCEIMRKLIRTSLNRSQEIASGSCYNSMWSMLLLDVGSAHLYWPELDEGWPSS